MTQVQTQNDKTSFLLEFLSEHQISNSPNVDFKVSPSGRIFSLQGRFAAEGLPKFLEIEKELAGVSIRVEGREELFYSFDGRGKSVQEEDLSGST